MKRYRGTLLASAILLAGLPLFGCGNALEGGSSPSGSFMTSEASPQVIDQDIFLTICTDAVIDPATGLVTTPAVYEPGITEGTTEVTLFNKSRPNTPTGESTNSDVTMSRYTVVYTALNNVNHQTVTIPSFDGAGASVVVPKDGSATMTVVVMPYITQEYIRSHYPTVGNTESLSLRATVKIWGEDSFQVTVEQDVDVTVTVENFNRC